MLGDTSPALTHESRAPTWWLANGRTVGRTQCDKMKIVSIPGDIVPHKPSGVDFRLNAVIRERATSARAAPLHITFNLIPGLSGLPERLRGKRFSYGIGI